MAGVVITINSPEPTSLYPAFITATSSQIWDEEVIIFFTIDGAPALKKGVMESITREGMSDLGDLVRDFRDLGGRIMVCELAFTTGTLERKEMRKGVEVVNSPTFIESSLGAKLTFSF